MTLIKRSGLIPPQPKQTTAPGQQIPVTKIQDFASKIPVTEGDRFVIATGANPFPIDLDRPGLALVGVSITCATPADLFDTYVTLTINGYKLLNNVNALQLIPNYAIGIIMFPTEFLLAGNDKIQVEFQRNDVNPDVVIGFNYQYYAKN